MKIQKLLNYWELVPAALLAVVFLYGYSGIQREAIHNEVYANSYQESLLLYDKSVNEVDLPVSTQDYFKLIKGDKTWKSDIGEERERDGRGKSKTYLAMVQGSFLFLFILLGSTMRKLKKCQSNKGLHGNSAR